MINIAYRIIRNIFFYFLVWDYLSFFYAKDMTRLEALDITIS